MKTKYPCPECDEACYYHCTKNGQQEPECVTNNGWIKIESEADLPKIIGDYWSFDGKEVCNHHFEHNPFWIMQWKYVTHYQPIQKPKPPVF